MNTILSIINIEDTSELAEAGGEWLEVSWRGVRGGASLPDDPKRQKS